MKDNFSKQASTYAQFRPVYPPELFEFLLSLVSERHIAWDCGCGNGQVAGVLAEYFDRVEATDISQKQLDHAIRKPNIYYQLAKAEDSGLMAGSVNLITVAQAIHWFNLDSFYREVNRVCKPGSVLAVWCYSLLSVNEETDRVIQHLYADILGDQYWDSESHLIDEHYQTIPFPFEEIAAPEFSIHVNWSLEHLIGYLKSCSAVQHYIQRNGSDPIDQINADLKNAWGKEEILEVKFPLYTRIGRILSLNY